MKEQIETAVPRRKLVAGDSDEPRKTATGHSCGTLAASIEPVPKSNAKMNIFNTNDYSN